jgi:AraC-like DNA-binding protein
VRRDLTIAGAWTQFVLRGLERCGLDVRALCRAEGLPYAELDDPDARVPRDVAGQLWRAAARAAGDPCLGLHAGERWPIAANNLLAHLVMSSATLRDGMRIALAYQRVLAHADVARLEEDGERVVVRLARVGGDLPVTRHEVDFMAAILHRFVGFVQPEWRLLAARFAYPVPPDGGREHARLFGCAVTFAADETELVAPRDVVDRPLPHHAPEMASLLEQAAASMVQRLAAPSMAGEVRARVRRRLPTGRLDVGLVAAELHLSPRTLQRRLDAEGTSFRAVVDDVRRDVGLALLAEGRALADDADAVGFAEPRVLVRAVKRWTGLAPRAWSTRAARDTPSRGPRG